DYVSDAITKYLPPWNRIPPWQVMLITTEPDKFYILARVHHLYISQDGISFGHLLMVDTDEQSVQPISNPNDLDSIENILQSVFRKPRSIPTLYGRICRFFGDKWNGLMKASIFVVDAKTDEKKANQRQVFPALFYQYALSRGYYQNNGGVVLVVLGKMLLYLFHLMYTAPRILLDELIIPMFHLPKHHLQKVSLSGRKLVHWTEPIPVEQIRRIRDKTGVASCEIQLYCLSAALHHYFQKYNYPETSNILSTARFVPQEQLLRSANRISSGLLCLSLPMDLPEDDALYGLHMMQLALQDALATQTPLYLASLSQYDYGILTTVFPSILARIVLYVLSTRYSIMLTQIEPHNKEMKKRRLIWGQEVESFIYWRPPQANVTPEFKDIVDQFVGYLNKLSTEAENYVPEYVEYEHEPETSEL
ncbi:hypothetical protein U1Q18_047251, partial [Sarracenia purpurea var. burkii]